jgi:hypothetical protein
MCMFFVIYYFLFYLVDEISVCQELGIGKVTVTYSLTKLLLVIFVVLFLDKVVHRKENSFFFHSVYSIPTRMNFLLHKLFCLTTE